MPDSNRVARWMVPCTVSLDADREFSYLKTALLGADLTLLPVCRAGRYLGVLDPAQATLLLREGGPSLRIADVTHLDLPVAAPDEMVDDALARLRGTGRCAMPVVDDGGYVVGVLLATTLLRAQVRGALPDREGELDLDQVRGTILDDHRALRALVDRVETLLARSATAPLGPASPLAVVCAELLRFLIEHMAREEHLLIPALQDYAGWGELEAEDLRVTHWSQRTELLEALMEVMRPGGRVMDVSATIVTELEALRRELEEQEKLLPHSRALWGRGHMGGSVPRETH